MSTDCNINVTAEVEPSPIEVIANLAVYVVGGSGVPDGGTTGQHLAKLSNTDGDTGWEDAEGIPAGGTAGQTLTKIDGVDYNADWQDAGGGNPFDQDLNTTDAVQFTGLTTQNGLTPTSTEIYNTFTDASNYERAKIGWNANVLEIGTEAAGTGVARDIEVTRELRMPALKILGGRIKVRNSSDTASTLYLGDQGVNLRNTGIVTWTNSGAANVTYDLRLGRISPGVLGLGTAFNSFTDGTLALGKTNQRTESAADPTTTEYPNDKDTGVHLNTSTGLLYHCHNYGGCQDR